MNMFVLVFSILLATNVFVSTVEISADAFPIIPSSAVSCLSYKSAIPGQAPVVDVSPSYFRIPQNHT